MKKLFDRFLFSVVEINDSDISDVIIKLYEEISDGKGKVVSIDFIDHEMTSNTKDYSDIALDIYYKNRGCTDENS